MKRALIALAIIAGAAAPAFADPCQAATEAATRSALTRAEAAGRRTATVRVACGAERVTLVLHRVDGPSGGTITVREVVRPIGGKVIDASTKLFFQDSSSARLIRLTD
jgi:hypothetical protein